MMQVLAVFVFYETLHRDLVSVHRKARQGKARQGKARQGGHCEDPRQQVAGALLFRLPPGRNKYHPGGPACYKSPYNSRFRE